MELWNWGWTREIALFFEDAQAGVEAAERAGMKVVGIGDKEILKNADFVITGLFVHRRLCEAFVSTTEQRKR